MEDTVMSPQERENINSILELAKDMTPEQQNKYYFIGVGLAYSEQSEQKKNELLQQ